MQVYTRWKYGTFKHFVSSITFIIYLCTWQSHCYYDKPNIPFYSLLLIFQYSIVLPSKSAFLHRDYLHLYITALPRSIYQYVEENFQCEDIAMSYMVSSLTGGKPPLMADYWAVKSMTEIYSKDGISGAKSHLDERHGCVTDFAELLGLKNGPKFNESGLDYIFATFTKGAVVSKLVHGVWF